MLTLKENLETIIQQKTFAPEDKQILLKEIARLKRELATSKAKVAPVI